MADPTTGRARGRSRGRARGTVPPPVDVRRPGAGGDAPTSAQEMSIPRAPVQAPSYQPQPQAPYQQPQVPAYQQPPTAQPVGGAAAGRAAQRGGIIRPGEPSVSAVTAQMGAMSMAGPGGDTAGRGARRGRRDEMTILATRPQRITDKKGESGVAVKLMCNYFQLVTMPNWAIQQYHVEFAPNIESSRMRRALLGDHRQRFGGMYLFDGMSDLKSPARMEHQVTELYSQRRSDGETIRITVKHTQELAPNNPELLRIFNTQMRRNLEHMHLVQIRRQYFDQTRPEKVERHKLEVWEGLTTAVGQHDGGILMVVDTVHKVLRTDNVLDMLRNLTTKGAYYKDEAIKSIVGCIVMTRYNNRTYRVDDIDWNKNPQHTFLMKDKQVSYIQYYKQQYEKDITDHNQPLLVCRPKERDIAVGRTENIYLIPELCFLTGLTDEIRSNFNIMRDLAQHMKLEPGKRVSKLREFMTNMKRNPQIEKEMAQWGLKFSENLVELTGRQVNPERVILGGNVKCEVNRMTADFSREMRDKHMFKAVRLAKWVVACPRRDMGKAQDFVRDLMSVGPPMGIQIHQPQMITLDDDRVSSYINSLKAVPPDTEMLMAVFPNNRKDRYDSLKKCACVDLGLPTQVMLGRTLMNKNLKSVATKVAIQMNCKLGGEAWAVEIPLTGTMCVGYDTYHDSRQKGLSAGGFVASLNRMFTRWYSRVAFHQTHQELSSALKTHLALALKEYQAENNNAVPERILFFRDGVSDGQLMQVQEWEVVQIESLLNELFPGRVPQLAFVVVTKRIAARFFAMNRGAFQNPLPGTVIDNAVTRPERYDFYLVSQSVRQGTVAPTHFNVIHDTTSLKPEHMQRLSYKLTHLYYNWPGTIRVPAPCQYAHKLAFLAGQSLHDEPHKKLASSLFYL